MQCSINRAEIFWPRRIGESKLAIIRFENRRGAWRSRKLFSAAAVTQIKLSVLAADASAARHNLARFKAGARRAGGEAKSGGSLANMSRPRRKECAYA